MKSRFKSFSFFTLVWTLAVILWGAWVRFSHSGDGCGKNWPLCGNQLLPDNAFAWIEWIHRVTSGLSLLLVVVLWFVSLKIYPKKHLIRKCSTAALILIIIEALIGAALVLASLTGSDSSTLRTLVLSLHLLNSLVLVGSLVFCWQGALTSQIQIQKPVFYFFLLFPVLALTGSLASLSNTLFPAESLSQALAFDLQPKHITLKLRPFHPLLALLFVFALAQSFFNSSENKNLRLVLFVALVTFLVGFASLLSLSPVPLKLIHLFIAYLLWITLVRSSFLFKP